MKEQIEKLREENGGFTLAELLIVVAIILVLVAIAIPVFTSSLHSSHVAADQANCRSLYADLQADYLGQADKSDYDYETHLLDGANDITFTDGETAHLEGECTVGFTPGKGYTVTYTCASGHSDDAHTWGVQPADGE